MAGEAESKKSANRCSKFGPTALKTVVLGIDLVGWSAANSHRLIEKVLENEKVQKQLAAELKKAGEALMKEQAGGKPVTLSSSLGKLGSATGGVLQKPLTNEVKKSAEYKKLETSLTQVKCAFDKTPVGAFVNKNKTLLIIVGSVAASGGGVAMYRAKAGDVPASALKLLPELSIVTIGAVDLSVKNLQFKPSDRTVGADVKATGKWITVKANLEIGATFANDSLKRVAGKGSLILTLNPSWQGTASGAVSWSREDAETRRIMKGSAALGVRKKLSNNANLNFQLFGNIVDDDKAYSRQLGVKSSLAVKEAVGKNTQLTLSPSYSAKVTQARGSRGYSAPQTDHRVFINLKLEFD